MLKLASVILLSVILPLSELAPELVLREPLEVRVHPRVTLAPGSFRVTALVEPDDMNEQLTIVVDSYAYRSSTSVPLDGAYAPRAHDVMIKSVPAGEYIIEAILDRADGTTVVRSTTASVHGPGRPRHSFMSPLTPVR